MKKNLLKTLLVSTLLAGATIFASCDENAGLTIGIPQTVTQTFSVDQAGSISFDTTTVVPSNLDSVLAEQGATRDDIGGMLLDSIKLTICDANGVPVPGATFSSIKELQMKVGKIGANEPLVLAAGADSTVMSTINTSNPIKLPLPLGGFDFLPYVAQPQFRVNMVGRLNSPITTAFFIKADISLLVQVSL